MALLPVFSHSDKAEWVQRERLADFFFFLSYAWHWGSQQGKLCECGAVTSSCSVSVLSLCAWPVQCVSRVFFFMVCLPPLFIECVSALLVHYYRCFLQHPLFAHFCCVFFSSVMLIAQERAVGENDCWFYWWFTCMPTAHNYCAFLLWFDYYKSLYINKGKSLWDYRICHRPFT